MTDGGLGTGQTLGTGQQQVLAGQHFRQLCTGETGIAGDGTQGQGQDGRNHTLEQGYDGQSQDNDPGGRTQPDGGHTQDQDQAILETAPSEKGGKSLLDSVDIKAGENIFEAVEKAQVSTKEEEPSETVRPVSVQQNNRRRKKKEAIATGKNLHSTLEARLSGQKKLLIVYAALMLVTFVVTILPDLYPAGEYPQMFFNVRFPAYIALHMFILGITSLISKETLSSGLDSLRYFSMNYDTGLLLMTMFSFISNIVLMVLSFKGNHYTNCYYTLCVVFALTIKTVGEYFKTQTALRSLITVMKSGSLESIQPVEDDKGRVLVDGGCYDNFPWRALENDFCPDFLIGSQCLEALQPITQESRLEKQIMALVTIPTDYTLPEGKGLVIETGGTATGGDHTDNFHS